MTAARGASGSDQRRCFASGAEFRHLGVYRDEPVGQPARRRQPGPGVPRFSRPILRQGGRQGGHRRRSQSVRGVSRCTPPPCRDRQNVERTVRNGRRPGPRDHGHLRRHRGHLRRGAGARWPRGRDRRLRAVLRFISAQRDHGERVAACGDAAAARLVIRSRGSSRRVRAAHAAAPAQHAA